MRIEKLILFFIFSLGLALPAWAQPRIIDGLVRVQELDPSIVTDMRYATANNFTKQEIYPAAVAVLRQETAQKLAAANAEFKERGYRIKIWDAYRPPYVQQIFWDLVPDERYVANPAKGGSRHNRGGAVDLTLVDANGAEVEMPTGFDDFSESAWPNNPQMSAQARQNLDVLTQVLTKHGFTPIEHEWWHWDDADWRDFPLVDVNLEKFLNQSPEFLRSLPAVTEQALVVEPTGESISQAWVTVWEKYDGVWQPVLDPVAAVIGKNGFAPAGEKHEGDGRTPSGVFALGQAFGYDQTIPTRLAYRQATADDFWVDDPESAQYNQWVSGPPQAKSYEKMRRDDELYRYGAVIEYNTSPIVPGKGSAIFLHVWRGPQSATAGCVAVASADILDILKWLNQTKHPRILLNPG